MCLSILIYLGAFALLFFLQINDIPLIYRTSPTLNWEGGTSYEKFQEFSPNQHHDVIFLGSSRAQQGYDSRFFNKQGLSSFNLGSSGQTIMQSYYVAKNYLTSSNTDLLILDLFDGSFTSKGIESGSDLIQNLDSDQAAFQIAWSLKDIRAINMFVLRLFSKFSPPLYHSEDYVGLGFKENTDSVHTETDYISKPIEFLDRQVSYFSQILSHCEEQGISILLIYSPKPKEYERSNQLQFLSHIRSIADQYQVPLWDYGRDHPLHSTNHFYDHHHLNQAGVEIFNAQLINRLATEGVIDLHTYSSQIDE